MKNSPKIAIHAHIFYKELWQELASCINAYIEECGKDNVETYLTIPESHPEWDDELPESLLPCKYKIFSVPNRGYDVAPFLSVLNNLNLDKYDYIVKLHTKRNIPFCVVNFHIFRDGEWRSELLSFCANSREVAKSIKAFARDRTLGMIAGRKLIDPSGVGMFNGVAESRSVLEKCGIPSSSTTVVCGTMFMVKASLLKPLQGHFDILDFNQISANTAHIDLGLAGNLEGAFGILVNDQGYRVAFGRNHRLLSILFYGTKKYVFHSLRLCSDFARQVISLFAISKKEGE